MPDGWHVIARGKGWCVRRFGTLRARRIFPLKGAAVAWARTQVTPEGERAVVYVHGADGLVERRIVPPVGVRVSPNGRIVSSQPAKVS